MFPRCFLSFLLLLGSLAPAFPPAAGSTVALLQARAPAVTERLWPAGGAVYYSLRASNGSLVHVVDVDMKSGQWQLKPVAYSSLTRTSTAARRERASAAVNGGFFDPTTGASVSFVIIDGRRVTNPAARTDIARRRDLSGYRQAIFNRSELRVLVDRDGNQLIQIVRHKDPLPSGYRLLHSLQGGPQLLPSLTISQEAFVRTDSQGRRDDPIRAYSGAARTAVGVTASGHVVLVAVEGPEQGGGSPGVSLAELASIMRALGCVQAVNLDGGHSTAMFVRTGRAVPGKSPAGRVVCGRRPDSFVKSVLVLVPVGAGRRPLDKQ